MMKMIRANSCRYLMCLSLLALSLILTDSASAKTTKIFKAVAAENEERTVNSDSSGADAEAEVTASPEPKKNDKSDKPKHSSKKKQQLKKTDTSDSNNVDSQILEEADKAVIDENQENVYEVLTDIRCILLGLMMCIGLLVGMFIAQSFERGIKK